MKSDFTSRDSCGIRGLDFRLLFAYYLSAMAVGLTTPDEERGPDRKRAKDAVVLAASIIAAPHLDGKGDSPENGAVIAEAMRVVRYMYRNLSTFFPELFR
jgi:hypothetical protein